LLPVAMGSFSAPGYLKVRLRFHVSLGQSANAATRIFILGPSQQVSFR
jgi:hypothetical protein